MSGQGRNPEPQRKDIPRALTIRDPDREHAYDHQELGVRNRDSQPDQRRSRPPVQAIADYLGLDEPICLICWQAPVERAHVVPESLGGSNDVRNFALLCPRHHREAPDVADAEAFWSWVDYACERDGHMKWEGVGPETPATMERLGLRVETSGPVRKSLRHFDRVRDELGHRIGDAAWRHSAAPPMSRGCWAASFDRDGTWDGTLDRSWKASPPKSCR
ncbi:HNH endonuclease [Streptomyces sp. MNP-20]|uniref:HNH endonuclease n=1 Tax=Streptomyces sp. MNP-20 TaxID=2721165 RepID=UPI001C1E46A2|nr:HNH endonuclease [Streptomyces sp. MNP-20]